MSRKIYIKPETWESPAQDLRYQLRKNGQVWWKTPGRKHWSISAFRKSLAAWRISLTNEGFKRI